MSKPLGDMWPDTEEVERLRRERDEAIRVKEILVLERTDLLEMLREEMQRGAIAEAKLALVRDVLKAVPDSSLLVPQPEQTAEIEQAQPEDSKLKTCVYQCEACRFEWTITAERHPKTAVCPKDGGMAVRGSVVVQQSA